MAELAAQQKLLKCRAYLEGSPSDAKLLYIFNKLLRFPVTVEILRDTGIGKVVNSFRKREGEIGEKARAVVTQWKAIVSQQDDAPVEKAEPDSPSTLQQDPKPLKSKSLSEGEKREKSLASRTVIDSPHSKNVSKSSSSSSSSDREHHDKISRTEKEKSGSVSSSTSKTDNSYHKTHSSSSGSRSSSSSKERHNHSSEDIVIKHSSSSSSKSSKDKNLLKDDKQRDKKTSKKDKKASNHAKTDGGLSFEDFMNYDDSAVRKKFHKSKNSLPSSSSSSKKKDKESSKEVPKVKTEVTGSSSRSSPVATGSLKRIAAASPSDVKTSIDIPSPSKKLCLSENDILSSLPETQTHYHPWRLREVNKEDAKSDDKKDDLDMVLAGIKARTRESIYSGKRSTLTEVPTLFNACIQILIENIDSLEYVGGIPFDILQPVLERCSVSQLYTLEDYNPHFLEESDKLWKIHSQRDFRGKKPDEMESWRELYLRLLDEREARLKAVRANITASMSKAAPERTVKMAFVEAPAKPPRDVRRRQLKFGTGTITKDALGPYRTYKPVNNRQASSSAPSRPSVGTSLSASVGTSLSASIGTSLSASVSSTRIQVSQQHRSTKVVAPMMMKTMKMMKRMQRR